jgi:hypothetical protein
MDDFRVGSIPPYDQISRHQTDDRAGRKKRKHPGPQAAEEDVVSLSDHTPEDKEDDTGYAPHREED